MGYKDKMCLQATYNYRLILSKGKLMKIKIQCIPSEQADLVALLIRKAINRFQIHNSIVTIETKTSNLIDLVLEEEFFRSEYRGVDIGYKNIRI